MTTRKSGGFDKSRSRRVWLFAVLLVLAFSGVLPTRAQSFSNPRSTVVVSGRVQEQDGSPVAGVQVILHQAGMNDQNLVTDPKGQFEIHVAPGIASTVEVLMKGRTPFVEKHTSVDSGFLTITLPLLPADTGASAARTINQSLEFADTPDFKVAGITDWTAVGGHGSDTTLRTSEGLARDTAALALPQVATASSVSRSDRAREQALRARLGTAPRDPALHQELGALYLEQGRFGEAVPVLETASTLSGQAASDEYALAQACAGLGDLHKAREHIATAIAKEPKAEFIRFSGELSEQEGDPLQAVAAEQRATQLDPSEQNYLTWASELLLHRAVWQAIDVLAKGSQVHPRSQKLEAEWGAALFAGARYLEASQHLCTASDLDPNSREPYLLLGEAVLGSPVPLPCATAALARFLRFRPDDPQALFYNAMLLSKEHEPRSLEHSQDLLRKAVALQPKYAEAYLQLGILASSAHETDEAVHDLQLAIAADPHLAEAHFRLGVLYDRSGKRAEAQEELHAHEVLAQQQREAKEEERRRIKQFVVVPGSDAPESLAP